MKNSYLFLLAAMVIGCTPKLDQYCNSFGTGKGNAEYSACQAYYTKMDSWFKGDINTCRTQAYLAFPESMDDRPHYEDTEWIDRFGRVRTGTVLVEPNFAHNQALELERRKIIVPCMTQHGWSSPDSWQAGRVGTPASPPPF